MSFDKNIADKILEFAKLEPTVPVGTSHDFRSEEFDQDDFRDTAKKLISMRHSCSFLPISKVHAS